MTIIYDEDQVRKFHALLKPLEKDEVYFVSMSARNKYLSLEERKQYDLGRTEMMGRKLVKSSDADAFIQVLRSYERIWYSRSGIAIPEKCLVCYANINTSSAKQALKEFYKLSNDIIFDLNSNSQAFETMRGLDTLLMNCFQRARGYRKWIDIDIDACDRDWACDAANLIANEIKAHGTEVHILETHSGYHILLNRESLNFNYTVIINQVSAAALAQLGDKAEVIRNPNDMVPLPGTLQAGYEVKLLY